MIATGLLTAALFESIIALPQDDTKLTRHIVFGECLEWSFIAEVLMLPKIFSLKPVAGSAVVIESTRFTQNRVLLANILMLMLANVLLPVQANEPWREHRNQAVRLQSEGDFVHAQKLFLQALTEVKNTDNTPVAIEILSRLASLNILHQSLEAAEPYYQEAIRLTTQEREKPKHEPEIDVFMLDLADLLLKEPEN